MTTTRFLQEKKAEAVPIDSPKWAASRVMHRNPNDMGEQPAPEDIMKAWAALLN
jgi:hypothetical protein